MGMTLLPVIVFKIDIFHVFSVHAKREPKITGHPYAPFAAPAALERMQSPTRKLRNLVYSPGLLDRMQDNSHLRHKVGANAASFARFVEAF
jgi:hypothetical protein